MWRRFLDVCTGCCSRKSMMELKVQDVTMHDSSASSSPAAGSPVCTALHRSATIAKGGFCKVYMCVDEAGRAAACKVLLDADKGAKEFARERSLLGWLRHPHVVKLLPEQAGGPWEMYLEWGGRDLLEVPLETRRKKEPQWVPQMLSAVTYLHQSLVAHRDLKLDNMVVDDQGKLRLVDFGLAVIMPHPAQTYRQRCGSRAYAAPEVLAEADYDPRAADAWSLGITLFAYATDTAPFSSAEHHDPHYSCFFATAPHCGVTRIFGPDAGPGVCAAMDLLVRVQPGLRATVAKAAYEYQAAQIRGLAGVRGQ